MCTFSFLPPAEQQLRRLQLFRRQQLRRQQQQRRQQLFVLGLRSSSRGHLWSKCLKCDTSNGSHPSLHEERSEKKEGAHQEHFFL